MKLRGHKEMVSDPNFVFMVGRIVGAGESSALLLQAGGEMHMLHRLQGERLDEICAWFLDKKPESVTQIDPRREIHPEKPEADTKWTEAETKAK